MTRLFTRLLKAMVKPHAWIKLWRKIVSRFIKLETTPAPVLFMNLLVKNEADILETYFLFHKAMGVDGFIVTDNGSTDETPGIIRKYQEMGWVKESFYDDSAIPDHQRLYHRMILLARDRYHADWVINADADELWHHPSGSLKTELRGSAANIIVCPLVNVLPQDGKEGKPLREWNQVVAAPVEDYERFNLSKYSLYGPQVNKVMHRTKNYIKIGWGNHGVEMRVEKKTRNTQTLIYHYQYRGLEQFSRKIKAGGEARRLNPDKNMSVHWRYLYQIYLDGKIEEEYKKVVGEDKTSVLKSAGVIKEDNTIPDVLRKILQ